MYNRNIFSTKKIKSWGGVIYAMPVVFYWSLIAFYIHHVLALAKISTFLFVKVAGVIIATLVPLFLVLFFLYLMMNKT